MKIQLKRSNVLADGVAKEPTAGQMEFGELAVNYNANDPVIFIKDSSNNILRLTNINQIVSWDDVVNKPTIPVVNDGDINVNPGTGLTASGNNATANQSGSTTRTIQIDTTWIDDRINTTAPVYNGQININAGTGLIATGSNATANQNTNTTRSLEIDTTWIDGRITDTAPKVYNGDINVEAGNGLNASGSNATANQSGNTTRTLTAVADLGYAIDITPTGIRFGNSWTSIPNLPN